MLSFDELLTLSEDELNELLEQELIRLADGDERKLWNLRKCQYSLTKDISIIRDPSLRARRMYQRMMEKFTELNELLNEVKNESSH